DEKAGRSREMCFESRPDMRRDEIGNPARQRAHVKGNDILAERRCVLLGDLGKRPEASVGTRRAKQVVDRENNAGMHPDIRWRHDVVIELSRVLGDGPDHFRRTIVVIAADYATPFAHPERILNVSSYDVVPMIAVDVD